MNVRTESASQPATENVLARIAALEASGFARPRSFSPDAYLAALADLYEDWKDDLRTLASAYAQLRFGGETTAFEATSVLSTANRVARSIERLTESGQIVSIREAWRLRTSMSPEPAKVPSPEEGVALAARAGADSLAEPAAADASQAFPTSPDEGGRSPSYQAMISGLRSMGPGVEHHSATGARLLELGRRLPRPMVPMRHAVGAFLVGAACVAVAASYFSDEWRSLVSGWNRDSGETSGMPEAVVSLHSPSPFPELAANQGFMPAWPPLFPSAYPHAGVLNEPIAQALSDLAAIYRDLGNFRHADAVYAYLARSRPDDYRAQVEYASYLLNHADPEARDAELACSLAERAYSLNSSDEQTVATFADALFATGNVARAVEIQQDWLDRERQPEIASNREERAGRTAG
ncbi:MAG TPA: DUF4129 domain-containing protein [Pirellulaceae bacterium]|jgi:hypothetical protein|nr:DUF4129 domain-containing protein [Pirellulaceae bacterium]